MNSAPAGELKRFFIAQSAIGGPAESGINFYYLFHQSLLKKISALQVSATQHMPRLAYRRHAKLVLGIKVLINLKLSDGVSLCETGF